MSDLATLNRDFAAERARACALRPRPATCAEWWARENAARPATYAEHRLVRRVGGKRGEREVQRQAGGCLLFLALCPLWMAACVLAWPGVLAVAAAVAGWFGR